MHHLVGNVSTVGTRILQINASDRRGGAANMAMDLHGAYRRMGYEAWMAVGRRETSDDHTVAIPQQSPVPLALAALAYHLERRAVAWAKRIPAIWRTIRFLREVQDGFRGYQHDQGKEVFNYPGSRRILDLIPGPVDVIHAHNLHGVYFDLRLLPELSRRAALVLTLHDAWLLSGHCAHSFDCERWRSGCGDCVDLTIPPPMPRDATAQNWKRKAGIYSKSRLFITTPSKWLMAKVQESMLMKSEAVCRVIPNGVDLSVFYPGDLRHARTSLNLPDTAKIVLFVANFVDRNPWKDYACLQQAVEIVAHRIKEPLMFVALGGEAQEKEISGKARIRIVPYQQDRGKVAEYYRAADMYVHAAKIDTFPTTIIEAMACGLPVVATAVGGVPEQVIDGVTGFLVPPHDACSMAAQAVQLLERPGMAAEQGHQAVAVARERFSLDDQVKHYLDWYQDALIGRVQK